MDSVEGYTINELMAELEITEAALRSRIKRLKIKPKSKDWIYDFSVLKVLQGVKGKGRPPKKLK